jgi:hypothetical protein
MKLPKVFGLSSKLFHPRRLLKSVDVAMNNRFAMFAICILGKPHRDRLLSTRLQCIKHLWIAVERVKSCTKSILHKR